jgi:hypothetical protein
VTKNALPLWAWPFFAICLAILFVGRSLSDGDFAIGGAAIGAGAAAGALSIARLDAAVPRRIMYEILLVAGAWSLFALLLVTGKDEFWSRVWSGAFAGTLVGVAPLLLGGRRADQRAANVCFVLCVLAGAVGGLLLAVPVAIGSVIFLRRRGQNPSARG